MGDYTSLAEPVNEIARRDNTATSTSQGYKSTNKGTRVVSLWTFIFFALYLITSSECLGSEPEGFMDKAVDWFLQS